MTEPTVRIAVYGEINMNLIDGSSVWLQSVCTMLASLPGVEVVVLLRAAEERDLLTGPLRANPSIRVEVPELDGARLLKPGAAAAQLEALDRQTPFDHVLLRGSAVADAAIGRGGFDQRLWIYYVPRHGEPKSSDVEQLRRRAAAADRVLCQTEAIRERVMAAAPDHRDKFILLPPMVPPFEDREATAAPTGPIRRLFYGGKFSPEYFFLEMVELFTQMRHENPELEFHVAGDKVHNPPADPSFQPAAQRALEETPGLIWHGGVSRERVRELSRECDIAMSIRHPSMDSSTELSTKILEYGAAGCAVLLNRNPVHVALLGADYPLLTSSVEEGVAAIRRASEQPEVRADAASRCHAAAEDHTFVRVAAGIAPHVRPLRGQPETVNGGPRPGGAKVNGGPDVNGGSGVNGARAGARVNAAPSPTGAPRVLVAGHDLKFFDPLAEHVREGGGEVREDQWLKHSVHDEAASLEALAWADTLFCEWCLGNAVFYSQRKRPGQRLVVRFHRMEKDTHYPGSVELANVDAMVFVAKHIMEEACERFAWQPDERFHVIPNSCDVDGLFQPKLPDAQFTLGQVGYVPMWHKRPDRALDVLERLRAHDERFRLIMKGRPPWTYGWMMSRMDEREAYGRLYARIERSSLLKGAVIFEGFQPGLAAFLQKIGYVVSLSDSEGHAVALAEGMASGAVPVVSARPGAYDQYLAEWVHPTNDDAARAILRVRDEGWGREGERAHEYASQWWTWEAVAPSWDSVLALQV